MDCKVKDMITMGDIDIDVYDDYDERCGIAFCGGYLLTDEGKERFKHALDLKVTIQMNNYACAVVHCDTGKDARACKEFFYAIAGFCSDEDFNRWFKDA